MPAARAADSSITYHIVQAFFQDWLNKLIINPKTAQIPLKIKKWGALFLEMHFIVLVLNACNMTEILTLKNSILFVVPPTSIEKGFTIRLPTLSEIKICMCFVRLEKFNRIMDRTMILMMKDTYSARFQSLLSMIHRTDEKFNDRDWEKLQKLCEIGDEMLTSNGNEAHSSIKMIEPICNSNMTELVHQHRPLIPKYEEFGNHVHTKLVLLSVDCPKMLDFFDFIGKPDAVNIILTFYGSFRHWGHPFLNALLGLKKMHERVTRLIKVDKKYAEALNSDLAHKVLESKFKETIKWMVDLEKVSKDPLFYNHISQGTWPSPKQIQDLGDNWHLLPLIQCFEIPDLIDPSQIYSDKSHFMNRSEVIDYIKSGKKEAIRTKKVLGTMINSPATNWEEFLSEMDKNGLDYEHLIIGLKEKERELKEEGRFFSLMSWVLREYFVVTEYLIKVHFLPLFKGLTMADDLNTLTKKMLENASGQGLLDYSRVSYSNHLDYEKWNNIQRGDSNIRVFRVMGQFVGYPNLIVRTHEFFEKSLIYYNQRPVLMTVEDDLIINNSSHTVTWNGQLGGIEGLRQKGWSV